MLEVIYVRNSSACGMTLVANGKSFFQAHHFLFYFEDLPLELLRQDYVAMLIGKVARIHDIRAPLCEKKETNDINILDERLANIINLPSAISFVGIRQERYDFKTAGARRETEELARWAAPNSVKFCLDEYTGPLPNRPPRNLFATRTRNMLLNDNETFVRWLINEWPARNGNRALSSNDAETELSDMRSIDGGREDHL